MLQNNLIQNQMSALAEAKLRKRVKEKKITAFRVDFDKGKMTGSVKVLTAIITRLGSTSDFS